MENTVCLQQVQSAEDFYQSAVAFGNFQHQLAAYPAHTLHETIPHFHDCLLYTSVSETLDLLKRWGADAIRDCDGTEFPQELKDTGAKIYATYYTGLLYTSRCV